MKKQIQLYYDPEDETYKTLISAKNKTYLLDVCYKFSVEFYKCQMKEANPDSEEVICYLIAMMYLLRQGGSLPGIAAGRAGDTGEWQWRRAYQPTGMHLPAGSGHPMGTYKSTDAGQTMDMGHLSGRYPSAGSDQTRDAGQSAGINQSAVPGQTRDMDQLAGMYQSAGSGQPAGMHQAMDMYQTVDVQSTGMHQSTDMRSSDMERYADMSVADRHQAEDGYVEALVYKRDPGNRQADGNPALASVMADVEII